MKCFTVHGNIENPTKLEFVFRDAGCFGGFVNQGAFFRRDRFIASLTLDLTNGEVDFTTNLPNVDLEGLIALGWVNDTEWSSGFSGGDNLTGIYRNIFEETCLFAKAYEVDKKWWRTLTPYERFINDRIMSFVPKSIKGSKEKVEVLSLSYYGYEGVTNKAEHTALRFLNYLKHGNKGVEIVGADRNAGFCVSYLMSYRNTFNQMRHFNNSQDISAYVRGSLLSQVQTSGFSLFFTSVLLSHYGDDSEVFAYSGVPTEIIGRVRGVFALEDCCHGEQTLAQKGYYHKGPQSTGLRDKVDKHFPHIVTSGYMAIGSGMSGILSSPFPLDNFSFAKNMVAPKLYEFKIDNRKILPFIETNTAKNYKAALDAINGEESKKREALKKKAVGFKEWIGQDKGDEQ